MKFLPALLLLASCLHAQAPVLYVHLVSHNEPNDNLQTPLNFQRARANTLQMANIVDTKNARWNLQTCDGFVLGALQQENAGVSPNDIFETLSKAPYHDNIEIDPRPKNSGGRNIADEWYLLDSCGANPTHHLGGFIYTTTNPNLQPIDWLQYRNPIIGNIYHNSWQCTLLCGAGSYPPHANDLNDFGIFKPDTTNNFYHHNPAKNLWCMGTGCAPVLDSLNDEQAIIDLIQGQVDSIQNGLWPAGRFYVTRIMTNQREYGPMFFQKISKIIDSLNAIGSDKLRWATIGETFTAFQAWQQSPADYSQWLCGQTLSATSEVPIETLRLFPNPATQVITVPLPSDERCQVSVVDFSGKIISQETVSGSAETNLDVSALPPGLYLVRVDTAFRSQTGKLVVQR